MPKLDLKKFCHLSIVNAKRMGSRLCSKPKAKPQVLKTWQQVVVNVKLNHEEWLLARSTAPGFWRLKPKAKILSRWQGHLLQAEVEPDAKQSSFEESIAKSPTPSYLWLINDWMAKIRIEN